MKNRYRKFHGTGTLLNNPGFHSTAAIMATVEDSSEWVEEASDKKTYTSAITPETVLNISDCDRTIRMDFDWDSEEARQNSLDKVDKMLLALTTFRASLQLEQERYVARTKKLQVKR